MDIKMQIEKTSLDGVLLITPPTIFEDFRGEYIEIYNKYLYKKSGINIDFIQDDISVSRKNVLRGLHGDQETWKLISCLYGSFYLVVVNNDPSSGQYKKSISFTLSDKKRQQILIPPKHGNGHLVLTEQAIFHYKQNTEYNRSGQFTIKWNDPEYKLWWPTKTPILSIRDE
jgi:dTDP-4-dehydrorhamnose 3,5-epimerase